ncbi:MAG: hypothetical protein LBS88_12395, partial [Tannerellaceae bacterium]|nr:hypothetical protein [Tannerellaceae bacterium]
ITSDFCSLYPGRFHRAGETVPEMSRFPDVRHLSLRGTKQSRVPGPDCFTLPFAGTARNDDVAI